MSNPLIQVGLGLLPVYGSQDHQKDWQPTRGKGDKLESNLTPEELEKLESEITVDDDDEVLDMDGTIGVDVE